MTVTGKVVKAENYINHGVEHFTDKYVNFLASVSTLIFAIAIILILGAVVYIVIQLILNGPHIFS